MTDVDTGPAPQDLARRVLNILIHPRAEWEVIDKEPATVGGIFAHYICPLALIPPVAQALGSIIFGRQALGIPYHPPLLATVTGAVAGYLLTLAAILVIALIIEALAPALGGQRNRVQALKVAAYSATPAWILGVIGVLPFLSMLWLVALYGIFLLHLGLPRLMKSSGDKALIYTTVVIVSVLVMVILVGSLVAPLIALMGG